MNVVGFFGEVKSELEKVSWPTRDETIRLTAQVIVVSAFIGIYLGGADFLFTKLLEYIIK